MELTDRELLIRFVVARDDHAFMVLVQRYERLVRGACRRVLRDLHLAEDAFQATFLVVAARAKTLCHRHESLAPWLYTVASNAALQLRRSRKRAQRREQHGRPASDDSVLSELLGMLDEELQGLDSESRDAIVLCHLQGMTQDDAAAVLGISKSTLRRRVDHGMEALRKRFRRRGLLVPLLAVIWNGVAVQDASATPTTELQLLAESARFLPGPRSRVRHDWRLSETSWNLSQKVLAMSRWNQVRVWSGWGLSICVVLGIGLLSAMTPSDAAEGTEEPAKIVRGKTRSEKSTSRALAKQSPGVESEPVAVAAPSAKDAPPIAEPPVKSLAAVKKPNSKAVAKSNPAKIGNAPLLPIVPGALPAQGGQAISMSGGASGGMSGGATATNQNGVFSGSVNINGREVKTNDPAEFQRLLQMQQAAFPQFMAFPAFGKAFPNLGGNGAAAGGATSINGSNGFQGTVNINGQQQTFTNQADFEKALQGLKLPLPIGK